MTASLVEDCPDGARARARVRVKVVPGASRSEVVGVHGTRLRVRIAAPPEAGKANRALGELLASYFGVGRRAVSVVSGTASPQKTVAIEGLTAAEAEARIHAP